MKQDGVIIVAEEDAQTFLGHKNMNCHSLKCRARSQCVRSNYMYLSYFNTLIHTNPNISINSTFWFKDGFMPYLMRKVIKDETLRRKNEYYIYYIYTDTILP